jgi:hypothetical protein
MVETKLSDNRSMAQRVQDRLKTSGGDYGKHRAYMADLGETTTYPTRTVHHFHHSGQKQHGDVHPGEGDLYGHKRGGV